MIWSLDFHCVARDLLWPLRHNRSNFGDIGVYMLNGGYSTFCELRNLPDDFENTKNPPDVTILVVENQDPSQPDGSATDRAQSAWQYIREVYSWQFASNPPKKKLNGDPLFEHKVVYNDGGYRVGHGKACAEAYTYTLVLPEPRSSTSCKFLHLIISHDYAVADGRQIIFGVYCGDLSPWFMKELQSPSLFLPPDVFIPTHQIQPEWLIVTLFEEFGSEFNRIVRRLMDTRDKISCTIEPPANQSLVLEPALLDLNSLNLRLNELRRHSKAMIKIGRIVGMQRDEVKRHLKTKIGAPSGNVKDVQPIMHEIIGKIDEMEKSENRVYFDIQDLNEEVLELQAKVLQMINEEKERNDEEKERKKDEMQKTLVKLTDALGRDSANMKVIAILTAFFLPFTFIAILLTTPMFKWPDPEDGKIIIWLPFRIYWAASGGMTLLLCCWGVWILHPKWLFPPSKMIVG